MRCMCCLLAGELLGVLKSPVVILTSPSQCSNCFQLGNGTPTNCAGIWPGIVSSPILLQQAASLKGNLLGWSFPCNFCSRLPGQRMFIIPAGSFSLCSCFVWVSDVNNRPISITLRESISSLFALENYVYLPSSLCVVTNQNYTKSKEYIFIAPLLKNFLGLLKTRIRRKHFVQSSPGSLHTLEIFIHDIQIHWSWYCSFLEFCLNFKTGIWTYHINPYLLPWNF